MLGVGPSAVYHLCVIALTVSTVVITTVQVLDSPLSPDVSGDSTATGVAGGSIAANPPPAAAVEGPVTWLFHPYSRSAILDRTALRAKAYTVA